MTSHQTVFVLHPEHKDLKRGELPSGFRSIPKDQDRDQRQGCLMLMVICDLLVLIPVIVLVLSDIHLSKRFLEDGRDITAQVIDCRMKRDNKRDYPNVTFSYTADGILYKQNKFLEKDCSLYAPGQILRGVYLPDEPTQIRFREQPETMEEVLKNALNFFLILGGAGVIIVTLVIGMLYGLSQEASPAWDPPNVAREGRITKIYREKEDLFVVEYRFKPSPKRSIKGHDEARRPDLIGVKLPEVGTPVTVLYTDRNNHRLM